MHKAMAHERVRFTLVGLLPRFRITANFSGGDPGATGRKNSLLQKQPSLPPSLSLPLSLSLCFSLSLSLSFSFSFSSFSLLLHRW